MFVNAKTTKAFDEIFKDALVVLEWIVDLSSLVDTPIPSLFVDHASDATQGEFIETSIPWILVRVKFTLTPELIHEILHIPRCECANPKPYKERHSLPKDDFVDLCEWSSIILGS